MPSKDRFSPARKRQVAAMLAVVNHITAERTRQVVSLGYDSAHDDQHVHGELASAAACYALASSVATLPEARRHWPFAPAFWKPGAQRDNLIKALALLVAEVERIDRAGDA